MQNLSAKEITYQGITYNSIREFNQKFNIPSYAAYIFFRKNRDYTDEDIKKFIEKQASTNAFAAKPLTYLGVFYPTRWEFMSTHNIITPQKFISFLNQNPNASDDDITAFLENYKKTERKTKAIEWRGKLYSPVSLSRETGVTISIMLNFLKQYPDYTQEQLETLIEHRTLKVLNNKVAKKYSYKENGRELMLSIEELSKLSRQYGPMNRDTGKRGHTRGTISHRINKLGMTPWEAVHIPNQRLKKEVRNFYDPETGKDYPYADKRNKKRGL